MSAYRIKLSWVVEVDTDVNPHKNEDNFLETIEAAAIDKIISGGDLGTDRNIEWWEEA